MHIVSVVGARPQFVKLAPISRVFNANADIKHTIVHTGQHYDDNMSSVFFDELDIPRPDVNLDIGSGGHGAQTGRMLEQLEAWFESGKPDVVLVYGDTNSTLAACLAAAKIHIPVAHVEAGLRSFNRHMPEEINRVAADHCSDRLYAPTPAGMHNLDNENLASRALLSGDVMRDAVKHNIALAESRSQPQGPYVADGTAYGVLTLHRPSNTTKAVLRLSDAISLVEPLSYLDILVTVKQARVVLTDSGGLQKEAAFLSTPCITLREETEWTETLEIGVNCLVGNDIGKISDALNGFGTENLSKNVFNEKTANEMDRVFGSGDAAKIIADDLLDYFS